MHTRYYKGNFMKKTITILLSAIAVVIIAVGLFFASNNHSKNTAKSSTETTTSKSTSSNESSTKSSSAQISSSSSVSQSTEMSSSTVVPSSSSQQPSQADSYDPNVTQSGQEITNDMIQKARDEINAAGIPADTFAPSDIKELIKQASESGQSVAEVAKQNFHP